LHGEAESLVTAKFFLASISLLFFVLFPVSLLKKGGEKYLKIQNKIPEKFAYHVYYQYIKVVIKKRRRNRWSPPGVLKKQKMKPQQ
jgi:hypothetical protein